VRIIKGFNPQKWVGRGNIPFTLECRNKRPQVRFRGIYALFLDAKKGGV